MAFRSAQSSRSTLGPHNSSSTSLEVSTLKESSHPNVHRLTDDALPSSLTFAQLVESLEDLPEELIVCILSHMDDKELLLCSLTSRSMNRLAVQQLLFRNDIIDPVDASCKVVLSFGAPKGSVDALTALRHSVHIKSMKRLDIHFTSFPSAHSLVAPLRQLLRVLRNLSSVAEMALKPPWHLARDGTPTHDKAIKEVVLAFEDVLNQAILRSCHKLYLHGSHNFMQQVYRFRGDNSTPSNPTSASGRKLFQPFIGARDYIDRRKEKKIDDPIIQDDLRYSRSTISGSRIFAHCSPLALSRTQLSHIDMNTTNFLRPPFSQWTFAILRASPIISLSFQFATVPQDMAELDFVLARLAAVLPALQSIQISGLGVPLLPTFFKFVAIFHQLTEIRAAFPVEDGRTWESFVSMPPLESLGSHLEPTLHTFAPTLCVIDGPVHYLTWLFQTTCLKAPDSECPNLPADTTDPVPLLPSLRRVHIDYFCIGGVSFHISTLAKAIRLIQKSLKGTSALVPPRTAKVRIDVHLKFDTDFRGLLPSWSRGDTGISRLSPALNSVAKNIPTDIEGGDTIARWLEAVQTGPDLTTQPSTIRTFDTEDADVTDGSDVLPHTDEGDGGEADGESESDVANLALLAAMRVISVILPCPRKDILEGRFKAKILSVITVFWGVEHMDLMSSEAYTRFEYVTPVTLPHSLLELFRTRNPRLRTIRVY